MRVTLVPAAKARRRLIQGNQRYRHDRCVRGGQAQAKQRRELRAGQDPFAVVLTCADSRVIPELIFDQPIGSLFVIRVAGNILDDSVLASIEYAVTQLHIRLIVVMGHDNCGAVKAAIDHLEAPDPPLLSPQLGGLVAAIAPAVASANRARRAAGADAESIWSLACHHHALNVARKIARMPLVEALRTTEQPAQLLPAHYHFTSGEVQPLARPTAEF